MTATEAPAGEPAGRANLYGLDITQLGAAIAPFTGPAFHAAQLYHWLYGRQSTDLPSMTDLPSETRVALEQRFRIGWPRIHDVRRSTDGSRKYLLALEDGGTIEAVYIVYGERITLCLSSQIGCPLACRFCLTGTMGLVRNLTPGEIAGQVAALARDTTLDLSRVRLVFMGMGEPLNNYDAVMSAFRLLTDAHGFGIAPRRITLSTAGIIPGIRRLAAEPSRPRLAISLAATRDELRDDLMPINRRYPLADLMQALRDVPLAPRERITFEYCLLRGANDSVADAGRLARLIGRLRAKVNLIPYNEAGVEGFATPDEPEIARFRDALRARGVTTTIRWSKGRDIGAACGQLASQPVARAAGG